jgi:hypothetical protein
MRLAGPDSIVGRKSYTAGVKVMLERHGFLIAEASEASELWDCGGAILVSHSLGSGMVAWLIRDTVRYVSAFFGDLKMKLNITIHGTFSPPWSLALF